MSEKTHPSDQELLFLNEAKKFLENDSILIKIADSVGKPIEFIHKNLPAKAKKMVSNTIEKAITVSLKTAIKTLKKSNNIPFEDAVKNTSNHRILHSSLSGISGGVCGFFGEVGLLVDLPVTTTLIMRNIASIANGYGFGLDNPTTPLECLYIFTLGSKSKHDDDMDSSYYTSRVALETLIKQSSEFIAVNSAKVVLENLEKGTAPVIIRFIAKIASLFEITVTEKMLAEAIPIVGAIGGATINIAFCDYFGQAAKYHFGLLRLEKEYGKDKITNIYNDIKIK